MALPDCHSDHRREAMNDYAPGQDDKDIPERGWDAEPWDLLGIAPDWTDGMATDEYMDAQRDRGVA